MGYSTDFKGELKFTQEPTAPQLAKLKSMFGEDFREHPEWPRDPKWYVNYIDLEFTDDFTGIRWNGAEKTSELDHVVEAVIQEMRKTWPDWGLTGTMLAQGEDIEDRWELRVNGDKVQHVDIPIGGTKIRCPHCEREFVLE